jgi:formate--tetrahydrofolate ligase
LKSLNLEIQIETKPNSPSLFLNPETEIEQYGNWKAKISSETLSKKLSSNGKKGKLILVTAITPTKAGEGKTTTSIGLSDGLNREGINMD